MRSKLILMALGLFGFVAANAGDCKPDGDKKNEINGTVFHAESKKPLKDVSVTAYLLSKKEQVMKTDDLGTFAFDELKSGIYKFVFEKAGYKKITKEQVIIKTDEAFLLNIEMIESKDFEIMPSPFHFAGGI